MPVLNSSPALKFNATAACQGKAVAAIAHLCLAGSFLLSLAGSGATAPAPKAAGTVAPAAGLPQFTFQDHFRRDWRNELVLYPVDEKLASNRNLALLGPDGAPRAYQWVRTGQNAQIAFLADVAADSRSSYRLAAGAPQTTTDLQIEETAGVIRLSNRHTGIAIRTALKDGEAPIAGIRLASGRWAGGSDRTTPAALENYQARIVARGPVFAEVLCEAGFTGGGGWRMRFRLMAGEPVVLVSESSSVGAGSNWRLRLDSNLSPTHIFHRNPLNRRIQTSALEGRKGQVFLLEPWVRWWEQANGNWVSLYNGAGEDLLSLSALEPALWVDLDKRSKKVAQSPPVIPVVQDNGTLHATFDLTGGVRRWMISALNKSESLKLMEEKELRLAAPPQQLVIKHGDFPLDRVKDWVLSWPDTAQHPRVMVTRQDVERYRKGYQADAATVERYRKTKLSRYAVADAVPVFLGTGDEQIGRNIAEAVRTMMQHQVDVVLKQEEAKGSLGAWPHNQSDLQKLFNVADAVWDSGFPPEEKERVKAQAALLGYTVNSPHYWSPERGYRANPNMSTMVAGYQAGAGALLADHPLGREWLDRGLGEIVQQVENWVDAEGGPLEAPHYALTSYELWLGQFVAARGFDGGKLLFSDKMKKAAEFFARISTPPDARVAGIRHMPRIGNTWLNEPSGIFGLLAALWKERDPKFASEMQWMHLQQGSQPGSAIGGAMPAFEGFRELNLDSSIAPKKPAYGSTLFPQTGVSLRNGVDDRETQLYLIAGWNHEHYDHDSGSITLWGKGRAVADDFAYNSREARTWNSMVDSGGQGRVMEVKTFTTSQHFDSVRGVSGAWHRQIAFVKDSDMLAPNYFVLRDSMRAPTPGTWRLWLEGKLDIVTPNGSGQGLQLQSAKLIGAEDVDTDIALITSGGVKLSSQPRKIETFGMGPNLKTAQKLPVELTGLVAPMAAGQDVFSVIFPRLKTQKPPAITSLAGGRAVKVEHQAGTDYIFLSSVPFTLDIDGIHFEGTSGLVRIRGNQTRVAVGEGGKLTARGETASGEVPAVVRELAEPPEPASTTAG